MNPTRHTPRNETQATITDDSIPHDLHSLGSGSFQRPGSSTVQDIGNGPSIGEDGVCAPINPSVATLDDDPNSTRRKRRKTKEWDNSTSMRDSQKTQEQPMETNTLPGPGEASHNDLPEHITPGVTGTTSSRLEYLSPATGIAKVLPAVYKTSIVEGQGGTKPSDSIKEKETPKRKTLKLNPNGKLLSSPILNDAANGTRKKQGARRGRPPNQKNIQEDKKLVIMKYGGEGNSKDRIGQLIDDIANGRRKHGVPEHPASAVHEEKGSPKPTHPFFLKKLSQKIEVLSSSKHQDPTSEIEVKNQDSEKTREKTRFTSWGGSDSSFQPFKRRTSKFPESIHPLWPPRGLAHVRGIETGDHPSWRSTTNMLNRDRKKDKTAVVGINDNEDVLLQCMRDFHTANYGWHLSPGTTPPQALRIPGKRATSGQALREAMIYELSESTSGFLREERTQKKLSHPAISKIASSMDNSMTAFDLGEFESLLWSHKYSPSSADEVLQIGREAFMLRDWLRHLMVSAVETGKPGKANQKPDREKRNKRRKKADKLGGFIVSSSDEEFEMNEIPESEDELAGDVTVQSKRTVVRPGDLTGNMKSGTERSRMSNAILLSGPSGCGKTASIHAVAKELGFEIFEINAGNRRSAKDILERVGDMTQNHLVQNLNRTSNVSRSQSPEGCLQSAYHDDGNQNKMMSFFKPLSARNTKRHASQTAQQGSMQKPDLTHPPSQKQSLILLEEADVLFEEDKQFWSGVMTLIFQSKRPIVITCNDESLIPLEDIPLYAILRYRAPPADLVADYLLLIAASEGHMLQREAVSGLYSASGKDLRRSIMDLNFWCQMGVGSEKSGLDWIIDRWPPGTNVDEDGHPLRMISLNTYEPYMGWFNRDIILASSPLNSEVELGKESLDWWQLSVQDSETISDLTEPDSRCPEREVLVSQSSHAQLDALFHESDYADARSVLDIICSNCSPDFKKDAVDVSMPPISDKQRVNYIEGYRLLHADLQPDYSPLSGILCTTFDALMRNVFRSGSRLGDESLQAARILSKTTKLQSTAPSGKKFLEAFQPIMRANYVFPPPTGRLAPSFENGIAPIAEDLAPYVRAIMAFDLRLEQYRFKLSGLLSQGVTCTKRMRKTRASRAALEGGDKASTRKERWFDMDANPSRILSTGKSEWQDILVQQGYFQVGSVEDQSRDSGGNTSDSSGTGGF